MSSGYRGVNRLRLRKIIRPDPTGPLKDLMLVQAAVLHEQAAEDRCAAQKQEDTVPFAAGSTGDAGTQHGRGHEEKGERREKLHLE